MHKTVNRSQLQRGDVVLDHTTLAPLYVVDAVMRAAARGYVVVTGATAKSPTEPFRTSGRATDPVVVLLVDTTKCPQCGGHLTLVENVMPGRLNVRETWLACDACEYAKQIEQ